MLFFILFLLMFIIPISSGNTEWIIFPILSTVAIIVAAFVDASNKSSGNSPTVEPPPKRRNQTEDEFNEMAITTLYANQWLDDD